MARTYSRLFACRKSHISAIMAIHDLNLGSRYSDRMVMLNRGVIAAAGSPFSVLTQDNIKQVYGVESVVKEEDGFPYVVPKSPIGKIEVGR